MKKSLCVLPEKSGKSPDKKKIRCGRKSPRTLFAFIKDEAQNKHVGTLSQETNSMKASAFWKPPLKTNIEGTDSILKSTSRSAPLSEDESSSKGLLENKLEEDNICLNMLEKEVCQEVKNSASCLSVLDHSDEQLFSEITIPSPNNEYNLVCYTKNSSITKNENKLNQIADGTHPQKYNSTSQSIISNALIPNNVIVEESYPSELSNDSNPSNKPENQDYQKLVTGFNRSQMLNTNQIDAENSVGSLQYSDYSVDRDDQSSNESFDSNAIEFEEDPKIKTSERIKPIVYSPSQDSRRSESANKNKFYNETVSTEPDQYQNGNESKESNIINPKFDHQLEDVLGVSPSINVLPISKRITDFEGNSRDNFSTGHLETYMNFGCNDKGIQEKEFNDVTDYVESHDLSCRDDNAELIDFVPNELTDPGRKNETVTSEKNVLECDPFEVTVTNSQFLHLEKEIAASDRKKFIESCSPIYCNDKPDNIHKNALTLSNKIEWQKTVIRRMINDVDELNNVVLKATTAIRSQQKCLRK